MTKIYARIADKTVAAEYFAVTEKVEALYGQPNQLGSNNEGREMHKLRTEMHRRMLGNGYCARPVEMDCHFESICESCSFFVTTIEFRPTLQRQRDDAARKGQIGRQKIFDGLLNRLDTDAIPLDRITRIRLDDHQVVRFQGAADQLRGRGLGVHRVHRDQQPHLPEGVENLSHTGDFVALLGDGELAEH